MPLYVLAVALVWPLAMTPADAIAMDVYGDVARSVVGVILTALLVWRGYAGMRERLFAQRTNPEVDHFDETESEHAPNTFLARHVRKVLAGSGFVMLGYVVVHMAGNLLAFGGPAVFNGYAHGLRELGTPLIPESGLLWLVRVVLTGALALHLAVQVSGALITAFVGYHLAQLTLGVVHPAFIPGDAYQNTIVALSFSGVDEKTIRRGCVELADSLVDRPVDRVRLPGGGRPPPTKRADHPRHGPEAHRARNSRRSYDGSKVGAQQRAQLMQPA